jgi:hypothetical protein
MDGALQLSQLLAMSTRTQTARAWYHMQRTVLWRSLRKVALILHTGPLKPVACHPNVSVKR